jgi:hypothetical protein
MLGPLSAKVTAGTGTDSSGSNNGLEIKQNFDKEIDYEAIS